MDKLEEFLNRLETELHERYQLCEDAFATPSSILLSVLNAIHEARKEPLTPWERRERY